MFTYKSRSLFEQTSISIGYREAPEIRYKQQVLELSGIVTDCTLAQTSVSFVNIVADFKCSTF